MDGKETEQEVRARYKIPDSWDRPLRFEKHDALGQLYGTGGWLFENYIDTLHVFDDERPAYVTSWVVDGYSAPYLGHEPWVAEF